MYNDTRKVLQSMCNVKSSLPVWYYWNAKAWMVRSIFGHYLNRLDSIMRRANRHILLLADNATSHKPEEVINVGADAEIRLKLKP